MSATPSPPLTLADVLARVRIEAGRLGALPAGLRARGTPAALRLRRLQAVLRAADRPGEPLALTGALASMCRGEARRAPGLPGLFSPAELAEISDLTNGLIYQRIADLYAADVPQPATVTVAVLGATAGGRAVPVAAGPPPADGTAPIDVESPLAAGERVLAEVRGRPELLAGLLCYLPGSRCPGAVLLPVEVVHADRDLQARAAMDDATVEEYAAGILAGVDYPAVRALRDPAGAYWLADGYHRLEAHRRAGRSHIYALVEDGTRRDAILQAAGANTNHGLPRTAADKRRAVSLLLADPEWAAWSNREIARRCAVSEGLVRQVRGELSAQGAQMGESAPQPQPQTRRVERGGTVYQQRVRQARPAPAAPVDAAPCPPPVPAEPGELSSRQTTPQPAPARVPARGALAQLATRLEALAAEARQGADETTLARLLDTLAALLADMRR